MNLEQFFKNADEGLCQLELHGQFQSEPEPQQLLEGTRILYANSSFLSMFSIQSHQNKIEFSVAKQKNFLELLQLIWNSISADKTESRITDVIGEREFSIRIQLETIQNVRNIIVWMKPSLTSFRIHERKKFLDREEVLTEFSKTLLRSSRETWRKDLFKSFKILAHHTAIHRAAYLEWDPNRNVFISMVDFSMDASEKDSPRDEYPHVKIPEKLYSRDLMYLQTRLEWVDEKDTEAIQFFKNFGFNSVLTFPMSSQNIFMGILIIGSSTNSLVWNGRDVQVFSYLSQLLLILLERQQKEEEIRTSRSYVEKYYESLKYRIESIKTESSAHLFKIDSYIKPYDLVGGDLIAIEKTEEGCIDIIFADVSGHGMSAAMVSGMMILSFKNATREGLSPKEAHNRFIKDLKTIVFNHHISSCYARYNPTTGEFVYSYAGHPPLLLLHGSDITELSGSGAPLLIFDDEVYEEQKVLIPNEAKLVFYTDGFFEAYDREGNMLGIDNFKSILLKEHTSQRKDFIQGVLQKVNNFTNSKIYDDMAMMVLERL